MACWLLLILRAYIPATNSVYSPTLVHCCSYVACFWTELYSLLYSVRWRTGYWLQHGVSILHSMRRSGYSIPMGFVFCDYLEL